MILSRWKRKKPLDNTLIVSETQKTKRAEGVLNRIKRGLRKTRGNLGAGLASLLRGRKTIEPALLESVETQLLMADVGVSTTNEIIQKATAELQHEQRQDGQALLTAIKQQLLAILTPCQHPLQITPAHKPYVILMVGVNGVGKTTTIGKMAKQWQQAGKTVILAAGDTFRAAAVEQLQAWGERNAIPVIAQQRHADSAAVVFDSLKAARARHTDILIVDTAGRLHTHEHLMNELRKIKRVIQKLDTNAPHEIMLVLDAGTGQNALKQAEQFHASTEVSGLAMTKLDGTAKGGVIFAIAHQLALPIRFIGVGEDIDDLRPFIAEEFVNALFEDT